MSAVSGVPQAPRTMGLGRVVDVDVARRVRAYVARVDLARACKVLRTGHETIDVVRGGGRLKTATLERLVTALEREERAA